MIALDGLRWLGCNAMLLLLAFSVVPTVRGEIQAFDMMLAPDESKIHYYEGYIRAPGRIDLTDLTFLASASDVTDDDYDDQILGDDEFYDDGGGRFLTNRWLDGGIETEASAVDIVVFKLPEKCANSRQGCDYTELGVGGRADDGTLRWCCTNDAITKGLCDRDDELVGRLIVDKTKFTGDSRFVSMPPTGDISKRIKFGKLPQEESAHYVVVMANCNQGGRFVRVKGNMVWMSEHGYLPGELYGIMLFYTFLSIFYLVMIVWYGASMLCNMDSRIPIEKWILGTILLGLVEMVFQTTDFGLWNLEGFQRRFLAYFAIVAGSLKQGISRCLAVMVGLGWGVVRDSLGSTMKTIVFLGTAYTAVSVLVDLLVVFAIEDVQELTDSAEEEIFDFASFLTLVLAALDVIFFLWMLDALNNTMEYLENMNQTRKLQRYLQLRSVFLFTILAAVIWAVFSVVDTYGDEGILLEEQEWIVQALKELIYTLALLGVAILWRPSPNAKEYAYVMELPSMGADGENDLELTGVVPSAIDDDDEYEMNPSEKIGGNGFSDDRFADAEIS